MSCQTELQRFNISPVMLQHERSVSFSILSNSITCFCNEDFPKELLKLIFEFSMNLLKDTLSKNDILFAIEMVFGTSCKDNVKKEMDPEILYVIEMTDDEIPKIFPEYSMDIACLQTCLKRFVKSLTGGEAFDKCAKHTTDLYINRNCNAKEFDDWLDKHDFIQKDTRSFFVQNQLTLTDLFHNNFNKKLQNLSNKVKLDLWLLRQVILNLLSQQDMNRNSEDAPRKKNQKMLEKIMEEFEKMINDGNRRREAFFCLRSNFCQYIQTSKEVLQNIENYNCFWLRFNNLISSETMILMSREQIDISCLLELDNIELYEWENEGYARNSLYELLLLKFIASCDSDFFTDVDHTETCDRNPLRDLISVTKQWNDEEYIILDCISDFCESIYLKSMESSQYECNIMEFLEFFTTNKLLHDQIQKFHTNVMGFLKRERNYRQYQNIMNKNELCTDDDVRIKKIFDTILDLIPQTKKSFAIITPIRIGRKDSSSILSTHKTMYNKSKNTYKEFEKKMRIRINHLRKDFLAQTIDGSHNSCIIFYDKETYYHCSCNNLHDCLCQTKDTCQLLPHISKMILQMPLHMAAWSVFRNHDGGVRLHLSIMNTRFRIPNASVLRSVMDKISFSNKTKSKPHDMSNKDLSCIKLWDTRFSDQLNRFLHFWLKKA